MENDLVLLLKYPLLSFNTEGGRNVYQGRIRCGTRDVDVHITERKRGRMLFFKLEKPAISGFTEKAAASIVEFLDHLSLLDDLKSRNPTNLTAIYRKVLNEYSEFTSFCLNRKSSHLATDLSNINISTVDENGREHALDVTINLRDFSNCFLPVCFSFPEQFHNGFVQNWSNLTDLYNTFLGIIEGLQPFFDVMDTLDKASYILDPEMPTRQQCHRQIWLDPNLSVIIVIDPRQATARPELRFLGPNRLVQQRYDQLETRLMEWDNRNFVQSLLNILGLDQFPIKPESSREILIDVGECTICFSLRLNDKLPEIICDNYSCGNFFHVECLYDWLSSISSRRVFNRIHGQCPNCEKTISCPLPSTK